MLCTACISTSSAAAKALTKVISGLMARSRSLGMTSRESTFSFSLVMPSWAWRMRRLPSNSKGLVTTPMVRMPMSWAMPAMTGAAPVPVPPPIPAVMNTMSVPLRAAAISSLLSSAAFWPFSGSPPAPMPRVSLSPMCSL